MYRIFKAARVKRFRCRIVKLLTSQVISFIFFIQMAWCLQHMNTNSNFFYAPLPPPIMFQNQGETSCTYRVASKCFLSFYRNFQQYFRTFRKIFKGPLDTSAAKIFLAHKFQRFREHDRKQVHKI